MLSHNEAQALISASLDTPLDDDIEDILSRHLSGCEECRLFAASSQRLASSLRSMPTIPESVAVRQGVWNEIYREPYWWNRLGGAFSGQTAAVTSTAVIALLLIAFSVLAVRSITDSGNDNGDEARLAAGTQEAIALATEAAELSETPEPTATEELATDPPGETEAPAEAPADPTDPPAGGEEPTEARAEDDPDPTPIPSEDTPVDLAGDADTDVESEPEPTTAVVVAAFEATETAEEPTPTATAEPTPTATPESTPTATAEPTAAPSEDTPVDLTGDAGTDAESELEPTAAVVAALEPTETVDEPTPTVTPEPTATATPEPTPTVTPEPTATATPEPVPGNLTVTLVDGGGEPVPDACFVLEDNGEMVAESCDTPEWETPEYASNGRTGFFDVEPGTYTLRMTSIPGDVTVEDQEIDIVSEGDAIVTIIADVATPEPVETVTPEPTATAEEATSPPIVPIDGIAVAGDAESDEASLSPPSVNAPSSEIVPPATNGVESASDPDDDEVIQVIEPVGGSDESSTTVDVIESRDGAEDEETVGVIESLDETEAAEDDGTVAAIAADDGTEAAEGEETPVATLDQPEASGSYDLADAPFYSDGQPWGPVTDRLSFQNGVLVFSPHPDTTPLQSETLTVQTETDGLSQHLRVCEGTSCLDATAPSASGTVSDTPIGWIETRLIYQRVTADGTVELRGLIWNGGVVSDDRLGTADTTLSPTGQAVPTALGTLIPAQEGWLLVSGAGAEVIDGNPYGEVRLIRTTVGADLIAYVGGGQLVVAELASPGTALFSMPFVGVDYDVSPDLEAVVISTGTGLEIRSRDGSLVGASSSSTATGSLVWVSTGILFLDRTDDVLRLVQPEALAE